MEAIEKEDSLHDIADTNNKSNRRSTLQFSDRMIDIKLAVKRSKKRDLIDLNDSEIAQGIHNNNKSDRNFSKSLIQNRESSMQILKSQIS